MPVVIAALHPKMLALAAAETNGTHTYFVPPEHTAKARAAIGPKPMICAAQAVILETDAAEARTAARGYMKTYVPRLPNYTNNLKASDGPTPSLKTDAATSWSTRSWRGAPRTNQRSNQRASKGRRDARMYPAYSLG